MINLNDLKAKIVACEELTEAEVMLLVTNVDADGEEVKQADLVHAGMVEVDQFSEPAYDRCDGDDCTIVFEIDGNHYAIDWYRSRGKFGEDSFDATTPRKVQRREKIVYEWVD